jgi:hypothetical protein
MLFFEFPENASWNAAIISNRVRWRWNGSMHRSGVGR